MKQSDIESVYVFGSAARRTTDSLSDRDVLVVAAKKSQRDAISERWRERGWSVAAYSPRRLLKMIRARSLFIQHLRMEGIAIEDRNGWLGYHLRNAKPKRSYEIDAQNSVSLALPLERLSGDALIVDELIAADLAYVAARNFGVCYLADKNRLTFEYYQIIEHLAEDFQLGVDEVNLLKALRSGKAAYRSGAISSGVVGTVGELRGLLSKFFASRPLREVGQGCPIRNLGTGYSTLREFEAWIGPEARNAGFEVQALGEDLQQMYKMVVCPREYSWDVRNLSARELEGMRRAYAQSMGAWTLARYKDGKRQVTVDREWQLSALR